MTPRRRLAAILGLLAAGPLPALAQPAPPPARFLPAQSEVTFVTRQMGVPVTGRFTRFDARLAFDPRQPQAGRVSIAVDMASATLGVPDADAELPKAPWFDTGRYAQASFDSTAMKRAAADRLDVTGRLTVKGTTRELTVPVALAQAGGVTTASGSFTIRRLAFRIGEGEWADTSTVADDVQVRFRLAFAGVAPL